MIELHLFQHGGIGDQIISLPIIKTFQDIGLKTALYTKFPDIAKIFLKDIEVKTREELPKNLGFWVELIDAIKINVVDLEVMKFFPEPMTKMYNAYQNNQKVWGHYIQTHPGSCNEMAKLALSQGLHRTTVAHNIVGEPYKEFDFDIDGIETEPFITLHDGFDSSHTFDISTKSWSMPYFEELVTLFKAQYPNIKVIQLGGTKHRPIKGVDENLAGKLSFEDSLKYLKSSILHIDGDSGLVHARHLFKKPSVVLFGPTNIDFFGYHENINIPAKFCGDCWWLKRTWMKNCVNEYPMVNAAKCMESITPEQVMYEVNQYLRARK